MNTEVSTYKREELYTYKEAADIIGVAPNSMYPAVSHGILTAVRLPHEKEKYLLKVEVDAIAGLGTVTSKLARSRVEKTRIAYSGSLDDFSAEKIESMVRQAFSKDSSTVITTIAKLLGGKISFSVGT